MLIVDLVDLQPSNGLLHWRRSARRAEGSPFLAFFPSCFYLVFRTALAEYLRYLNVPRMAVPLLVDDACFR